MCIICVFSIFNYLHLLQNYYKEYYEIDEKLDNIASDAVHCIRTVKRFGNEEHEADAYMEKLKERYQASKKDSVTRHALGLMETVIYDY